MSVDEANEARCLCKNYGGFWARWQSLFCKDPITMSINEPTEPASYSSCSSCSMSGSALPTLPWKQGWEMLGTVYL